MNQGLVLETERLALHPLSEADLDALHRISNEPLVRLYLWDDVPVSMVQIEGILEQSVREFAKKGLGLFGIRLRGEAKLLVCAVFVLWGTPPRSSSRTNRRRNDGGEDSPSRWPGSACTTPSRRSVWGGS